MTLLTSSSYHLAILSQILGWIYTISWSLSFYPQPWLNWKRRSTIGSAIDFPFLNVVGFTCYSTATSLFLFSPTIRSQYASRHPQAPEPTARINDFAFGAHAVVAVGITFTQYYPSLWGFATPRSQHISRAIMLIVMACAVMVTAVLILVLKSNGFGHQNPATWTWIDVVYALGNVKIIVTFVKYTPQAILNYKRKSTAGWSIYQVLFDLVGGVLSLAQLLIDSSLQGDWSGVSGNPVKLGLSVVSTGFDIIFMVQHYVLYRHDNTTEHESSKDRTPEHEPLLRPV